MTKKTALEVERERLLTRALVKMDRRKQAALRKYRETLKGIEADYNGEKVKAYELGRKK